MNRIKPGTTVHQIKGNLRKHCKQQHSKHILFKVPGVKVSLDCHKGENGKGHSSGTGKPLLCRKKGSPKVIHQHKRHGDDMQCRRTDIETIESRFIHSVY